MNPIGKEDVHEKGITLSRYVDRMVSTGVMNAFQLIGSLRY